MILHQSNKNKIQFEIKIQSLEKTIIYLTKNIETQAQKIKISDDLKNNMRKSNQILSNQIVDMNMAMFAEMFPKK